VADYTGDVVMDEIEALSNDELLAQINAFDPYDVEFVRRFRALEAQLAKADALAMAVTQEREMVCQDFGMQMDAATAVHNALTEYRAAGDGRRY